MRCQIGCETVVHLVITRVNVVHSYFPQLIRIVPGSPVQKKLCALMQDRYRDTIAIDRGNEYSNAHASLNQPQLQLAHHACLQRMGAFQSWRGMP